MLDVQYQNDRAVIDVRDRILKGEHPRYEILNFVKQAPKGTIFEIHLPHRAEPLISGFSSFGMNVIVNQLKADHFRLMTVKLKDI